MNFKAFILKWWFRFLIKSRIHQLTVRYRREEYRYLLDNGYNSYFPFTVTPKTILNQVKFLPKFVTGSNLLTDYILYYIHGSWSQRQWCNMGERPYLMTVAWLNADGSYNQREIALIEEAEPNAGYWYMDFGMPMGFYSRDRIARDVAERYSGSYKVRVLGWAVSDPVTAKPIYLELLP